MPILKTNGNRKIQRRNNTNISKSPTKPTTIGWGFLHDHQAPPNPTARTSYPARNTDGTGRHPCYRPLRHTSEKGKISNTSTIIAMRYAQIQSVSPSAGNFPSQHHSENSSNACASFVPHSETEILPSFRFHFAPLSSHKSWILWIVSSPGEDATKSGSS